MITATVEEAQARFTELVQQVQRGETVVITSGSDEPQIAMQRQDKVGLGGVVFDVLATPGFVLSESFWEPLPEEELRLWNGEDA